jgi:hypothetical protein
MCARPLYYSAIGRTFLVASRPSSITAVNMARVDQAGLAAYLVPQLCDPHGSPWRGIQRLPPGHALIWHDGEVTVRQVSGVMPEDLDGAERPELVSMFRDRLRTALRRCSGEANALLLSGGIDSSALAGAYTTVKAGPVHAFGLTYESPLDPCDERQYAHDVSKHTGIGFDALPGNELLPLGCAYPIGDEPDPWPYAGRNWALLQHITSQLHAPTVIAGEGGDEMLLGQVFSVADRIARGDPTARAEISTFPNPESTAAVVEHLLTGAYNTGHVRVSRAIGDLPPWFTRSWIDQAGVIDRLADGYPHLGPAGHITPTYSQSLIAEAGAAGRAQCGGWWTDTGLRAGADITYPFYDPDLAALIWALPPDLIRSGGLEKAVLREALPDELPPSVATRRDKAEALALLHPGLTTNANALRGIATTSPLIDLGIVNPQRLIAGIDRYLAGHTHLGPALWALVSTHQWLTATTDSQ